MNKKTASGTSCSERILNNSLEFDSEVAMIKVKISLHIVWLKLMK